MNHKKVKLTAVLMLGLALTSVNAQTVKDVEGNVYKTVKIGSQTWMAENLKTTKYRNGELIGTTGFSSKDIKGEIAPKYQWAFAGKDNNADVYGRLYTWYAATDSRGVCPSGWHVPTDAEWSTLVNFLGGDVAAYSKLKETDDMHWIKYDTGTNEFLFTALPGGVRSGKGAFDDMGSRGCWWSSTESGFSDAWYRLMTNDISSFSRYIYLKRNALSVRCIMTLY